jgi:hypothetical protein
VWDVLTNQAAVDFVRERLQCEPRPSLSAVWCVASARRAAASARRPVAERCGRAVVRRLWGGACSEAVLDHCLSEDPRDTAGLGADNMTCVIVDVR